MARTYFPSPQSLNPRQLAYLHDSLQAALRQVRLALGGGLIFYGFEVQMSGTGLTVAPGLAFDGEGQVILLESPLRVPLPEGADTQSHWLCLRYHALVAEIDNENRTLRERDSVAVTWLAGPPRDEMVIPVARVQKGPQGWAVDGTVARRASIGNHRHSGELRTDARGRLRWDGAPLAQAAPTENLQPLLRQLQSQLSQLQEYVGQVNDQQRLQAIEVDELRREIAEVAERQPGTGEWQENFTTLREELTLLTGEELREELEHLRAEVAALAQRPALSSPNAGRYTPVHALHGIGTTFAKKLNEAGITTVSEFLAAVANPDSRARLLAADITPARLRRWSREADFLRLHGVGSNEAQLLDSLGLVGTAAVAVEDPRTLYEKLRALAQEREWPTPAYVWVESWVAQAQQLPPVVEWAV